MNTLASHHYDVTVDDELLGSQLIGECRKLGRRHILVVDDDPIAALVLSEYLAADGYRTTVASNADGATLFARELPDLALVDVPAPHTPGVDSCLAIKHSAHGRATPLLLMSAVYLDLDHARRFARGVRAQGYLRKPFDLDELRDRVRALVGAP